ENKIWLSCVVRSVSLVMRTSGSARCGLLGQGSTASTILLDLLVCQVLDSDESVVSMRAANQFIQLSLQCTSIPVLSVLNDKNHQKCHDSGSSIDNELPRIRVVEDRTCETPTDDNQDSKKKRNWTAGQVRNVTRNLRKNPIHCCLLLMPFRSAHPLYRTSGFLPPPAAVFRHTLTAPPSLPKLCPLFRSEPRPCSLTSQSSKIRRCCVDRLNPRPKAILRHQDANPSLSAKSGLAHCNKRRARL